MYTKELVGYAISKRMTADLVCSALNMAIKNKGPSKGLIVHSDRGSQYCSHAYHKTINQRNFEGSMSWYITKIIEQGSMPSATSLDILSCTTIRREFKRIWAIDR